MVRQCLGRRIPDKATLVPENRQWERSRNREGARVEWMFTVERARDKLGRAYPAHFRAPATASARGRFLNRSEPLWPSASSARRAAW